MDDRNNLSGNGQRRVKVEGKKQPVQPLVEEVQSSPTTVLLRLRISARYITYGAVTGNRYEFNGAGSVLPVHPDDAVGFLLKKSNSSCCSGNQPQNIFEVVGE